MVAGQGRSYEYDAIGNRREFHRDVALAAGAGGAMLSNLEQVSMSYGVNNLNQVDEVTPSMSAVEISGLTHAAVPEVAVGVLAQGAAAAAVPADVALPSGQLRPPGNGEPGGYSLWLASAGTGVGEELGRWPVVAVTARQASEVAGEPGLSQTQRGRVRVPWAAAWEHDADGNLSNDGEWQCGWNADNQLTSVERIAAGLPLDVPLVRLEHHYDWMSRRVVTVKKEKRSPDGSAPRAEAWSVVETRHFWYDGWNLMAETVQGGATDSVAFATQRYAWGTDLGGTWETGLGNAGPGASRTAAGGVGALLGVRSAAVPEKERLRKAGGGSYSVCQDANGNVMGFIDLETGALAARFDYDAFGNAITDWSAPGQDSGWISRIRFSGKWQEAETGWVYYGYRWYLPEMGRWLNKDPIGEQGGINIYGMVGNDTVNRCDYLGLDSLGPFFTPQERAAMQRRRTIETALAFDVLMVAGAGATWEDIVRAGYSSADEKLKKGLNSLVASGVLPEDLAAKIYTERRNWLVEQFRSRSTPVGRFIVEKMKPHSSLPT